MLNSLREPALIRFVGPYSGRSRHLLAFFDARHVKIIWSCCYLGGALSDLLFMLHLYCFLCNCMRFPVELNNFWLFYIRLHHFFFFFSALMWHFYLLKDCSPDRHVRFLFDHIWFFQSFSNRQQKRVENLPISLQLSAGELRSEAISFIFGWRQSQNIPLFKLKSGLCCCRSV